MLIRVADVQPERVSWLWPGYIPLGKITLLDGDPGLGKSNITLDLAARVTRGGAMPDGSQGDIVGPADVILLSAEDGIADTIRPRLEAAGADLTRVHVLESFLDAQGLEALPEIPGDLDRIERIVEAKQAALIIIDPLMAYLSASTNSFRDQDVRRALAPVKSLAERAGASVLVVRHLNKSTGGSPIYRGGGSIGIIGAARAGLLVGTDPDDESGVRRVLATTKHNLGPEVPSLAFHIEPSGDTCRVSWDGPSEHTASTILAASQQDADGSNALNEAVHFLTETLSEGEVESTALIAQARKNGISEPTLRRAKGRLGVTASKQGYGAAGKWVWGFPAKGDHQNLKGDHPKVVITLDGLDHLKVPLLPETCPAVGVPAPTQASSAALPPNVCSACSKPIPGGYVRCQPCASARASGSVIS